uniref:DUF4371 domain-containing protein n=1 Tax=Lates calcarifer TaxID=8187 RepID=A0A4W6C4E0_LATCA
LSAIKSKLLLKCFLMKKNHHSLFMSPLHFTSPHLFTPALLLYYSVVIHPVHGCLCYNSVQRVLAIRLHQCEATKASFMLAFKLAKASKPLSKGEFLKECMVKIAGLLCPESKDKFEKISLSCRTVTRCVELIDEDIASEIQKRQRFFRLYSLALNESNNIKDTAQLLIFIQGINDSFEITEEFLTMEFLKGKTRGQDLYEWVSAVIERMKLLWSKLANITMDGSLNLTGKNVGLLKRIQDKVKEENPDQDVIFLHCIIHQESLCKSVLHLNHVENPVVKLVNFIRARGLQHRQFITFLEETDADHQDLLYHSRVHWLSLELALHDVKLQGKDHGHDMYTNVSAFKSKLTLFSRQICSFSHTSHAERGQMLRNTANHWTTCMENSAVGSLI